MSHKRIYFSSDLSYFVFEDVIHRISYMRLIQKEYDMTLPMIHYPDNLGH